MLGNEEIGELFETVVMGDPLPQPSWHIHPTDQVRIVLDSAKAPGRRLAGARWDLARPQQAQLRRPGAPLINIRVETVRQKFAWAIASQRCLIPATGYWEWTGAPKARRPHYFHHPDGALAFAGVYSWWRDAAAQPDSPARWVLTAALLTTAAVPQLAQLHDRTPLLLPVGLWGAWLDPATSAERALLEATVDASRTVAAQLVTHPVAPFRTDAAGPELIAPSPACTG